MLTWTWDFKAARLMGMAVVIISLDYIFPLQTAFAVLKQQQHLPHVLDNPVLSTLGMLQQALAGQHAVDRPTAAATIDVEQS